MGDRETRGFTIIEVMLFLAVTGLLTIGIIVGSGMTINQQRYRDSVNSFKVLLQNQFNLTTNTVNDRPGDESCANAVIVAPPETVADPQPRGTSNCLLMGRLLTVGNDGQAVTLSDVIGYRTSETAEVEATDLEELTANYTLGVSNIGQINTNPEWSTSIVAPKTTTPYAFSFLIISSPLSGSIMTFEQEGVQTNLNAMVARGVMSQNVDVCLDQGPGIFLGERLAVRIGAYAASQSAIEIPAESDGICD